MRVLVHLDLHTHTPRHLLIRARNRSVQSESTESMRKQQSCQIGKRALVEVEVLLQNVDVSILFHYSYINVIEFSAYLFIHLHLQCSCTLHLVILQTLLSKATYKG